MRRKFIIIISSLLFILPFIVSAQGKKETIQFDSMTASIGSFSRNDAVKTAVYSFKNLGSEKLVFYGASGDCGCITVAYPEKPVKPGRKGKITVTYDGTRKDPGRFSHKIYFSTSGKPSHFILRLNGEMTKN
jgi:hypothetical protein